MRKLSLVIFYFLLYTSTYSQDISGIWKGSLTQGPGGCFSEYNMELQIQITGNKISGASYHFYDVKNYVKEEFEGTFFPGQKLLRINETKVLTFNVPADCVPCIKKYELTYSKIDNKEIISGDWGGITMSSGTTCPPGKITLMRIQESNFINVDTTVRLTTRKNELVKEIKVDTGSIKLDFYDNGQIDGDTITVFVDKKPVVFKKRLSALPISFKIYIDLNKKEHEVVMVADNMGSIPPNTALMLVTVKNKRYQLFLTSTETKNAMVRFVYEKPN